MFPFGRLRLRLWLWQSFVDAINHMPGPNHIRKYAGTGQQQAATTSEHNPPKDSHLFAPSLPFIKRKKKERNEKKPAADWGNLCVTCVLRVFELIA